MQDDFRPSRPLKPVTELKPTPENTEITERTVPFQTPDQIREHDVLVPEAPALTPKDKPRGTGHHWFNLPWPPTRIEILFIAGILLIGIAGITSYVYLRQPADATPVVATKPVKKAPPKPTTIASSLSGLPVAPEVNQRPVVGVMIENSPSARPQSGLSQAGVVFEAIAEGGITRFLALFQDQQPSDVGPVRSARPYYVQWNEGFRAAYAHVGGSPDALVNIKDWGVQDLNQFYNAGVYHRVSSRPSPHNMYSSVVDLANLATQKGFKSEYTGFVRKPAAASKQPTATSIDINISSQAYNPHYAYDAASNTYQRFESGVPQMDSTPNTQLHPNVVIAMVVPLSSGGKTAQGGSYSNYNPIGSGEVFIFQDGVMTTGTWTKTANTAPITFADAAGKPILLNPGQTWISAVTAGAKVVYK